MELKIPRKCVSLTVSRLLELNQPPVLAIHYAALSSCHKTGQFSAVVCL